MHFYAKFHKFINWEYSIVKQNTINGGKESIMERFHSYAPITMACDMPINHMAFDGCDYFCTIKCKCQIIKFDICQEIQHKYCTCREYDCICYDYGDHCFWASSKTCYNQIFKLDCHMNEIDCIHICAFGQHGVITGISYHCCKNALLVSFTDTVVEVEKCNERSKILCTTKEYCIMGVLSVCPGILLTICKDNQYYIEVINEYGEKTGCYGIEHAYVPQNLIWNPCISGCQKWQIWIFALKRNCYPYLCKWDISLQTLGFIPCSCNFEKCSPCEDIMESIALMETSLSHILNAEGEKLQKVLATTDDIDKILCVNRAVNKTIVNVTHLEHTLYAKLSALLDSEICHDCCDNSCGCQNGADDNKTVVTYDIEKDIF